MFYFVYFFKLATGVIIIFIFKLSPLLGQEETDKLDNKLRSLNVTGNENPPSMMITITSTARCKTALVKLITHLFLLQTLTTSIWATCSSSPTINTRTKPGLRLPSLWMTLVKQSQSILLSCQKGISNENYIQPLPLQAAEPHIRDRRMEPGDKEILKSFVRLHFQKLSYSGLLDL